MENLMHHNEGQYGLGEQFAFENNLATPDETCGVDGRTGFRNRRKQFSAMCR
jgi:hypothetical protein